MIEQLAKYRDVIEAIRGNPLLVTSDMPVFSQFKFDYKTDMKWSYKNNTLELRAERYSRLVDCCKQHGLNTDLHKQRRMLEDLNVST